MEIACRADERLLTKAFARYLLPSAISILFCQIAPFVDALCVSYKLGDSALSAIGIVAPIFYLFNIPAVLGGIGGGIAISNLSGAGTPEKSGQCFTRVTVFMFFIGLVLSVAGLFMLRRLTLSLGGLPENMDYAEAYLRILLLGAPCYILCFAGVFLLLNDNAPKLAMAGMVVSNTVNIVIDLLGVVVWNGGMEAAAWGTVAGQVAGCAVYALHFLRKERLCRFDFSYWKKKMPFYPLLRGGMPEAVKYLLFFAQLWVTNHVMKSTGGIAGLADAAIVANLVVVAFIFMEGISEPVLPLAANLYGENNGSAMLLIKRIAIKFSLWIIFPFAMSILIWPMWFPALFRIDDPVVLAAMPEAMRFTAASFLFSCFNLIIINHCAAAGRANVAILGVVFKIPVLLIPLTFLLRPLDALNAPWAANLLAEMGTLLFFITFLNERKGLFRFRAENLQYLSGGILTEANLARWKKEIPAVIDRRYSHLAEKAFFRPLTDTLARGGHFRLAFSILNHGDAGTALVLRYDAAHDMLQPPAKNGFSAEKQFSLQRRMITIPPPVPDASGRSVVIVAPECYSGKRLVECAREAGYRVILCVAAPVELYEKIRGMLMMDECVKEGLCDRVIVRENWQELARELRATEPDVIAVIPGSEFAVESAEPLAKAMNVRGNPPESTGTRRNKFDMKQAISAAGLDHAKGGRFSTPEEALAFVERELSWPVIVKPPEGAASHNVFLCKDRNDFLEKVKVVLASPDDYRKFEYSVLVEEFIDGDEYAVNIFGDDEKILVTSIWKYEKVSNQFADNLYWNDLLMDLNDPAFDALKEYAVRLYKAVGIRLGPGHAEIKLSGRGPVAIEIGARLMGSACETYMPIATHIDSPLETLNVFTTGKSDVPNRVVLYKHLGLVSLPFTQSGRITAIRNLDKIRKLPGYFTEEIPIRAGDVIEPSSNLDMITCAVWLRTGSFRQLLREQSAVHRLFAIETCPVEDKQEKAG